MVLDPITIPINKAVLYASDLKDAAGNPVDPSVTLGWGSSQPSISTIVASPDTRGALLSFSAPGLITVTATASDSGVSEIHDVTGTAIGPGPTATINLTFQVVDV